MGNGNWDVFLWRVMSSVRSDLGSFFGLGRVDLSGLFWFYLRCEENLEFHMKLVGGFNPFE